jgi:hypothetical protein
MRKVGLLVITAVCTSSCMMPDAARLDRSRLPIETPATLADIELPDFRMKEMRIRRTMGSGGGWGVRLEIENTGGNKGVFTDEASSDGSLTLTAYMRLQIDVLLCSNSDYGQDNFTCENPRSRSFTRRAAMPPAGESRPTSYSLTLGNPWQVWVNATAFAIEDDEPITERDSPLRLNNQALLKIVWDTRRSSFDGQQWTWPNDEDTLPF